MDPLRNFKFLCTCVQVYVQCGVQNTFMVDIRSLGSLLLGTLRWLLSHFQVLITCHNMPRHARIHSLQAYFQGVLASHTSRYNETQKRTINQHQTETCKTCSSTIMSLSDLALQSSSEWLSERCCSLLCHHWETPKTKQNCKNRNTFRSQHLPLAYSQIPLLI